MFNRANLAVASCLEKGKHSRSSVEFSPEGTMATNGHLLMAVDISPTPPDEAPAVNNGQPPLSDFEPFWTSAETAQKAKKSLPKSPGLPVLEHAFVIQNGDKPALITTDLASSATFPADGEKPYVRTWKNVFPEGEPVFTIHLNADSLYQLIGAFREAMRDRRPPMVRFSFYGDDKAVRMDAHADQPEGQKIRALLMPMNP